MSSIPKSFVLGAKGYLGQALHGAVKRVYPESMGLTRNSVPLEDPDLSIVGVEDMGYEWGIIAAAVPGLAHCEANPGETRACNVDGTLALARQMAAIGIRPVWFSSDQVFDGTAGPYTDETLTSPVNEYGRQKAEVEARFAEASSGTGLVIRLSKVYDCFPGSGTLLDAMLTNLGAGNTERAASDLIFCPTLLGDVVACTLRLMTSGASGIANVAAGPVSRLALATMAAEVAGVDASSVQPMRMADLNEPFARPGPVELVPSPRLGEYKFQDVRASLEHLVRARA